MNRDFSVLDEMAIIIPPGENAQCFYGDNLEGYAEFFTHATGRGSGYWLDGQPLYRDFCWGIGKRIVRHEESAGAIILPDGLAHYHGKTMVDAAILHRQRAVSLAVRAENAARLMVAPLFDPAAGPPQMSDKKGAFVLTFSGSGFAVGVAANTPLQCDGPTEQAGLNGFRFSAAGKVKHLAVYLAFADNPREALTKARKLVKTNARLLHAEAICEIVSRSRIITSDPLYNRAVAWAKLTSYFMVTEEFGKGIWAGLPWFKNNWGRDTFIALPGTLLVSGMFGDARDVITNFLRYQDRNPRSPTYGRVPNRVAGAHDIIYNTADGTPWLIRELYEYMQYTGDVELAETAYPDVKMALDGAIKKFVDDEGFLTHDDADTWMDARIMGDLPWSARGNRANDIQALWFNALLIGVRMAEYNRDVRAAKRWQELADRLKHNFKRRFWNARSRILADRIDAKNRRDEKARPNQLMCVSIPMIEPLLDDAHADAVVENATTALLYPYGIASLSQDDPYFHPYHHRDDLYHFDAAYHNGTVWGWNAGFTVTALCRQGHIELAARLAANLADQIINLGCRGSMSELIEAIPRKDDTLELSGTWAQAWSTSEFARNAYQDFGGFNPRLLDGALHLHPHFPEHWTEVNATFPFGGCGALTMKQQRMGKRMIVEVSADGFENFLTLCLTLDHEGRRFSVEEPIAAGTPVVVMLEGGRAWFPDEENIPGQRLPRPKKLTFATPSLAANPPCLKLPHYLQEQIERGLYR